MASVRHLDYVELSNLFRMNKGLHQTQKPFRSLLLQTSTSGLVLGCVSAIVSPGVICSGWNTILNTPLAALTGNIQTAATSQWPIMDADGIAIGVCVYVRQGPVGFHCWMVSDGTEVWPARHYVLPSDPVMTSCPSFLFCDVRSALPSSCICHLAVERNNDSKVSACLALGR